MSDNSHPDSKLLARNAKLSDSPEELARWAESTQFWAGTFREWLANQRGIERDPEGQW